MTRITNNDYYGIRYCDVCNKGIEPKDICVKDGSWIYHLTCFNSNCNRKITMMINKIKSIKKKQKLLKPYTKEMICESIEGIKQ